MKTTNIVSERIESEQVGDDATAMTMDADSSVFMMDMLGKLYARPAQAALREYLSNAYDAHTSKGGELPRIQVKLPSDSFRASDAERILSIRDFGNGMSESEFKTILSRYGKSTKRDSNSLIGGFGLGAKAGFALGDEFFMTSYQNGTGLRVRLFKDDSHQGYVEVVERFQTSEPDGMLVEVFVPLESSTDFSARAMSYFFWGYDATQIEVTPLGSNTLSVGNPEQFTPLTFNDRVVGWFGKPAVTTNSTALYAVVGAVTYKLRFSRLWSMVQASDATSDLLEYQGFFNSFPRVQVLNLPIGSVEFPSSREEITLSERSLRTIVGTLSTHVKLMHSQFQKEINQLSYLDAMMAVGGLESVKYPRAGEFTWRGKRLGEALLKASEAYILDFQKIVGQVSQVSLIDSVPEFGAATYYGKQAVIIPTQNAEKADKVRGDLRGWGVSSVLIRHLKDVGFNEGRDGTLKFATIIAPEGDPLLEMFSEAFVLDVSVVETLVSLTEHRNRLLKEAKEKEREEALAALEAKRVAEASRVASFMLVEDDRQYLALLAPELVYGPEKENACYYWSEEEITLHNVGDDALLAFPYTHSKVEPNDYCVVSDETGLAALSLHIQVRTMLSFLLPQRSNIVLVGSHVNLEEFKAQHPEIPSAMKVMLPLLKGQVGDDDSPVSLFRALLQTGRSDTTEVQRIARLFNRELNQTQQQKLDPGFSEALARVLRESKVPPNRDNLNAANWEALLSVFVPAMPPAHDSIAQHQKLMAKYPLLFNSRSFDNPRVVEEMIEYINWKSR